MGTVYLAHERGLDRDVAIKVLPPERAESAEHRDRFRLEARAAARLNHANIVPLHTFGEHEGMLYYVMGYVEGESLADRLNREGHLGEGDARRILSSVAEALHYGHGRGVLHRDVKPHNILLESGSRRALLTDFGISKLATEATMQVTATGMILGTPDYMSPEQASGSPDVDGRSDLYSLGIVGYRMLSGRLPFQSRTPGEAIAKRLVEDPARLATREPAVSVELIDAIMRCLARDPRSRWQDCAAFASALTQNADAESEPFEGVGLVAALCGYAAIVGLFISSHNSPSSITYDLSGKVVPALALLVGAVTLGVAMFLRRKGRTTAQIAHFLFREPAAWTGWSPAALRRRGNVWTRLPRQVRVLRAWYAAVVAALWLTAGMVVYDMFVPIQAGVVMAGPGAAVLAACVAFTFLAVRVRGQLMREGMDRRQAEGIAYSIPASKSAFWSRPTVAEYLDRQGRAASTNIEPSAPTQ